MTDEVEVTVSPVGHAVFCENGWSFTIYPDPRTWDVRHNGNVVASGRYFGSFEAGKALGLKLLEFYSTFKDIPE